MQLVPVTKTTSAQSVAHQILDMIRHGVWKPGDQLPAEKDLIEKLSVGRSTIREALQILATVNVVQAAPGQGTFIKAPTANEVFRPDLVGFLIGNSMALELLEAREMIEPQTVRLACIRGSVADFEAIERLLDQHEAARVRGQPISEYAAKFHVMLAEASHNRVATMFMSSILGLLMERGRRFDHIPDFHKIEIDQHRVILEVVKQRDADRAAEVMLRHIVESATTYDSTLPLEGGPLLVDPVLVRPARAVREGE